MPLVYLSPSTQEFNPYYDGQGNEEFYMNLIVDAMEPYLTASGIEFVRNTPDMTAASSIRQSNEGNYDVHLAVHSNAAPESLSGRLQGTDVYFYPFSERSTRLANIISSNLKAIYLKPDLVNTRATTTLGEVVRTKAPAVLVELAYHDNKDDAEWIRNNIGLIGRNLALSLTEYFGIPFVEPQPIQSAVVDINSGNLNIRKRPSLTAEVIGKAPDGAKISVLGSYNGWYIVRYNGLEGYVRSEYVTLEYNIE